MSASGVNVRVFSAFAASAEKSLFFRSAASGRTTQPTTTQRGDARRGSPNPQSPFSWLSFARNTVKTTTRKANTIAQVLRYSALAFGVFYGFTHQRTITATSNAAHAKKEYEHQQQLIEQARAKFAEQKNPKPLSAQSSPCTSFSFPLPLSPRSSLVFV